MDDETVTSLRVDYGTETVTANRYSSIAGGGEKAVSLRVDGNRYGIAGGRKPLQQYFAGGPKLRAGSNLLLLESVR